jgi:signal transduction histidine kinase
MDEQRQPLSHATRLAPRPLLSLSALMVLALAWLTVWLAMQPPWLGIQFAPSQDDSGLRVAAVHPDGPAGNRLAEGTLIRGIRSDNGGLIELATGSIIEEPDFLPSYSAFNQFFARQGRIYRQLSTTSLLLVTPQDETISLQPRKRPLFALPTIFWFQLVCGAIACLTGIAVWAFRRDAAVSRYYALSGISFMLITFTAAIYSGRELALTEPLFHTLSVLNHLGAMLFSAAFISLVWHYPEPLSPYPLSRLLFPAYLTIWVLDTLQWLPGTDWGIRLPVIAGLGLSFALAGVQWRRSRNQPINRAILKWFLFSLFIGGSTFVAGIFVVVWLGEDPLIPQGYAFGVILTMYLGMALGITRYRLFALERWWVEVWFWLLAGAGLVSLDLLLVFVLDLTQPVALGVALLLAGWAYFPFRQWLMSQLFRNPQRDLQDLLPELLRLLLESESRKSLGESWRRMLSHLFAPLDTSDAQHTVTRVAVSENGQELHFPGLADQPPTCLAYPDRGRRLFTQHDLAFARAIWQLLQQALSYRNAYEEGMTAERSRVARDLHDDIGTRLLTLSHRAKDPQLSELARDALRDLRAVIANLDAPPASLEDTLADWRAETEMRCEAAGLDLTWQQQLVDGTIVLDARQQLNLLRTVREAISNALRHAHSQRIQVDINTCDPDRLRIRISNDGDAAPPEQWQPGCGLNNMRSRIVELGGTFSIESNPTGGSRVILDLPIME